MFQVIVELEGRVTGSRKKVGKRQQGYDQNVGPRKEGKKSTKGFVIVLLMRPGNTLPGLAVDYDTG